MSFRDPALRACALTAVALVSPVAMIPVDARLLEWIQAFGPCRTHALAHYSEHVATWTLSATFATVLLFRRPRRAEVVEGATLVIGGAAVAELFKTAIERLRPRSMPYAMAANSLPSGHVVAMTILACVAWSFVQRAGWPRWVRALTAVVLASAVVAQASSRILRGSHWASDIAASTALASVWVLACRIWMRRQPVRGAWAATTFVVLYAVFYAVPSWRIHVPSVIDRQRNVVAAYDVSERQHGRRRSSAHSPSPPVGAAGPESSADIQPEMMTLWSVGAVPRSLEIVLDALCVEADVEADATCARVHVALNGWSSPAMEVRCGARWYRLIPPPGVLRKGENRIAVSVADDDCRMGSPSRVSVRSLALVADAGVGS